MEKDLAHLPGFEAAKGFDYSHAVLQEKSIHRARHKIDSFGKRNTTPKITKDHPCLGCGANRTTQE